jgi:SAM-dependent methyltransferase
MALELGCGTGAFSLELIKSMSEGCKHTLVDSSPTMAALCRVKVRKFIEVGMARVVQLSMASVDTCLPPATYDFVAASLGDPFLKPEALDSIRHVCTDSARLFVTFPEKGWAERQGEFTGSPSPTQTVIHDVLGRTHVPRSLTFTEGELRHALQRAGFSILQLGVKTHTPVQGDTPMIWKHPPRIVYALAVVA